MPDRSSLPDAYCLTLGEIRELTDDMPDDTPVAIVMRKAHDPDHFYETVLAEDCPMVNLDGRPTLVLTSPEPRDVGL